MCGVCVCGGGGVVVVWVCVVCVWGGGGVFACTRVIPTDVVKQSSVNIPPFKGNGINTVRQTSHGLGKHKASKVIGAKAPQKVD